MILISHRLDGLLIYLNNNDITRFMQVLNYIGNTYTRNKIIDSNKIMSFFAKKITHNFFNI